jgi:hypothetical protein
MPLPVTEPTLLLSDEERSFLVALLEQALHDKKIEAHRTEAFEFRKYVEHEVALLQNLIDKLHRP